MPALMCSLPSLFLISFQLWPIIYDVTYNHTKSFGQPSHFFKFEFSFRIALDRSSQLTVQFWEMFAPWGTGNSQV